MLVVAALFLKNMRSIYHRKRHSVSPKKTIDISSVLIKAGLLEWLQELPKREVKAVVTYQDSCHLRNVNQVITEPRAILNSLPGIVYKELPKADMCCGSAGVYNLLQPQLAGEILKTKMHYVKEINPAIIVTANPGCLLQMQAGIHLENLQQSMQARYIVDLLYSVIKQNE